MKAALSVALLSVVPYMAILDAPFVFDDLKLVRDNPTIRDLSSLPSTFNIVSRRWDDREVRANYRPLRFLSYAIDYRISRWVYGDFRPEQLPTRVFHIQNVLLHALSALLLLGIGRALLSDGRAAVFLGLLFALHPLNTEAVTYISGRRDVLSTFFFLAALLVHLKGEGWMRAGAVAALFVLGLFSKEMVVTLPGVLLLIDLARRSRFDARRVILLSGLWVIAGAFTWIQASNPGLLAGGGSMWSALLTAPRYVARYLKLILFPHPQSIDYSFDAIPLSTGLLEPWTTLPCLLLLLGLAAAGIVALLRSKPAPATGLLWFLGTLTPVLQIFPIPERFAERFAYLPSIGIFLCGAAFFRAGLRRGPQVALTAAALCLSFLGLGTVLRNQDWSSPLDLWGSAARVQPRAARAHLGHGHALQDAGRLRDAALAYSRALSIWGDSPPSAISKGDPAKVRAAGDDLLRWGQVLQARTSRAQCYGKLGAENPAHYQKAVDDYRWLLAQRDIDGEEIAGSPRYLVVRYDLASSYLGLAQAELSPERAASLRTQAAEEFRRVAAGETVQPSLARAARYYLSKIILLSGRPDEALQELEEAFRLARDSGDRMDRYRLVGELSDLLLSQKKLERADDLLRVSAAEIGDLPERRHLLYRRARIAEEKGEVAASARLLEDALEIDPRYAPALLSLATLEERRGNLDRSEGLYRRLLEFVPGEPRALRGLKGLELRRLLEREGNAGGAASAPAPGSDRLLLEGLIARGESHLERGEILAAVEPFRRAAISPMGGAGDARSRPLRSLALRRLASIARKLKKYREAESYLALSIASGAGDREALRDLADLQLRDLKDREGAAGSYQEYLDSFPPGERAEAGIYVNLGSLVRERDPSRAVELFLTAKQAGYVNPVLDRNLGYLLARLGRWEDALESFEEYLDAEPGAEPSPDAEEREKVREYVRRRVLPMVGER